MIPKFILRYLRQHYLYHLRVTKIMRKHLDDETLFSVYDLFMAESLGYQLKLKNDYPYQPINLRNSIEYKLNKLVEAQDSRLAEQLVPALSNDDAIIRERAVLRLQSFMHDPNVASAMFERLENENIELIYKIIVDAIATTTHPNAKALFADHLKTTQNPLAIIVIQLGLGNLGDTEQIVPLLAVAKNENGEANGHIVDADFLRHHAIQVLGRMGATEAFDYFVSLLDVPEYTSDALIAIGGLRDSIHLDLLMNYFEEYPEAVGIALGYVGDPSVLTFLREKADIYCKKAIYAGQNNGGMAGNRFDEDTPARLADNMKASIKQIEQVAGISDNTTRT